MLRGEGPFPLQHLCWEHDTEPYARTRDGQIRALATQAGVRVEVTAAALAGHAGVALRKVSLNAGVARVSFFSDTPWNCRIMAIYVVFRLLRV